jgi:hypothetical protein
MTRTRLKFVLFVALIAVLTDGEASGTDVLPSNTNTPSNVIVATASYHKEALCLVTREANRVAQELQLPEQLPIIDTNLVRSYITPNGMLRFTRAIGNVTTSNYTYYVSVDGKFSFLESAHQDSLRLKWFTEYSWPISRLDTNAAYQLATQWLADVSMDVQGLNRDCNLHIRPTAVRGEGATARFLPLYWVYWTKGTEGQGSMASVGLFLPTKTLLQLRVENTQYILRKPLQFTNLDLLLSPSKKQ